MGSFRGRNIVSFFFECREFLCPPGEGVYTVHTAREKREALQQALYLKADEPFQPAVIKKHWIESFKKIHDSPVHVLGLCSDTGGGIQRGANWGPLFIRQEWKSRYTASSVFDLGDIRVIPHLLSDKYLNLETLESCREALYGHSHSHYPVSPLSIAEKVCDSYYLNLEKPRLLALGGDHSVSYPFVKAYLEEKKRKNIKAAIIHFDAHTDLMEKRLGIDLCFASWVTHILPYTTDPRSVQQIGIRSSGQTKGHWEDKFGIRQYWAAELLAQGAKSIAATIKKELHALGIQEMYISFDIDAIDQSRVQKTGTPEAEGPDLPELIEIIESLAEDFPLTGADIVEVAPLVQGENPATDRTLEYAADLFELFQRLLGRV
jgi:agmatinase